MLANRLLSANPSPTVALNSKALDLKNAGVDVINLAAGEPDFDTPSWIRQAATEAMEQGLTKYTAVEGILKLREAICQKLLNDNQLEYNPSEIIVGVGAKHVIFNALMATVNPGDEVIIPAPYWVSYPEMVRIFEGTVVITPCQESAGFKLTPQQLEKAITPDSKWLILNSPSNPTGSVYSEEELKALADVLRRHPHVYILCDDIYEYLVYDNEKFVSFATVAPDMKERTLAVNGLSKSFSMTGWRIGYGAGPQKLIKAMTLIQSQSTTNITSMVQGAGVAALKGPRGFLNEWKKAFVERRNHCLERLNSIPGLSCIKPQGAFYLFVNCKALMGFQTPDGNIINSDENFCIYLLESANVAVVHGSAFGMEGYFRLSYATKIEFLKDACNRIETAISKLTPA